MNLDWISGLSLVLNVAILGGIIRLTRSYSRVELKVDTIWEWFIKRTTHLRDNER